MNALWQVVQEFREKSDTDPALKELSSKEEKTDTRKIKQARKGKSYWKFKAKGQWAFVRENFSSRGEILDDFTETTVCELGFENTAVETLSTFSAILLWT